jgi:hypothetical protein
VSCEGPPWDHPLRYIQPLVDAALSDLSPGFARLYAPIGHAGLPRPRIPPIHGSSSPGPGSTRWTKSAVQAREPLRDGSLAIAFAYHLGDEAVLKAERATHT